MNLSTNSSEYKIIKSFKTLVEKLFVPQLHKMDSTCRQEWNKFSQIIQADQINLNEVQFFIDSLPSPSLLSPQTKEKSFLQKKTKKQTQGDQNNKSGSFNPVKTFGGQRNKVPMFPLSINCEEKKEIEINQKSSKSQPLTTQMILPQLDRIYKNFMENQQKIQKILVSHQG